MSLSVWDFKPRERAGTFRGLFPHCYRTHLTAPRVTKRRVLLIMRGGPRANVGGWFACLAQRTDRIELHRMHISQTGRWLNEGNSGKFLTAAALGLATKYFSQEVERQSTIMLVTTHSMDILVFTSGFLKNPFHKCYACSKERKVFVYLKHKLE